VVKKNSGGKRETNQKKEVAPNPKKGRSKNKQTQAKLQQDTQFDFCPRHPVRQSAISPHPVTTQLATSSSTQPFRFP
jgi:hypothetical protein